MNQTQIPEAVHIILSFNDQASSTEELIQMLETENIPSELFTSLKAFLQKTPLLTRDNLTQFFSNL